MPDPSVTLRTFGISVIGSVLAGVIMGVGARAIATNSDIARMEATLTSIHDQLENTESKIIRV